MPTATSPKRSRPAWGRSDRIRIVVNAAMQAERQSYVNAAPYQHTPERQGHANGYKPKTVKTRLGEIRSDPDRVQCCHASRTAILRERRTLPTYPRKTRPCQRLQAQNGQDPLGGDQIGSGSCSMLPCKPNGNPT